MKSLCDLKLDVIKNGTKKADILDIPKREFTYIQSSVYGVSSILIVFSEYYVCVMWFDLKYFLLLYVNW